MNLLGVKVKTLACVLGNKQKKGDREYTYPLEKRNVGTESGGREVSMSGEIPVRLAAAITDNGGAVAAKARVLMSMLSNIREQRQCSSGQVY